MDYAPVTTIFGPQSSGKSTLLKILNYCAWLEKQVMLPKSDVDNVVYNYTHYHHFRNFLCQFFRFDKKMFSSESLIHYTGECVEIIRKVEKTPQSD